MTPVSKPWTVIQVVTVFVLTVGSAGWVVPAYLAASLHMAAVEHAVAGTLGDQAFSHVAQAQAMLKLSAIWLFAVLFVWGFFGARRLLMPTRGERMM